MKKKIVLVNYEFTTGTERFKQSILVSLKYEYEGQFTVEEEQSTAIQTVIDWFKGRYPESELISVVPNQTISALMGKAGKVKDLAQALRDLRLNPEDDGYSAEMPLDRIHQLASETSVYTDRLILNGLADWRTIKHFERQGCYVNTMKDESDGEHGSHYTVIRWGK